MDPITTTIITAGASQSITELEKIPIIKNRKK